MNQTPAIRGAARMAWLLCGLLAAACTVVERGGPGRAVQPAPAPVTVRSAPAALPPPGQPPTGAAPTAPAESPRSPARVPDRTRATTRPAPAVVQAAPPVTPAVPVPAAPAAAPAVKPPLDLGSLEARLRETKAIGVFTKISLKNQVDDLLDKFRAYYRREARTTLAELRRPYELLMLKVLSLLQDSDPPLARDIVASREAIWAILSDPQKFRESNLMAGETK